jgi:hypothetical protein
MAPPSIDEPVDLSVPPQEPSSPFIDNDANNDAENDNDSEKEVSVGEILYGVESFHAIVQPGKRRCSSGG